MHNTPKLSRGTLIVICISNYLKCIYVGLNLGPRALIY